MRNVIGIIMYIAPTLCGLIIAGLSLSLSIKIAYTKAIPSTILVFDYIFRRGNISIDQAISGLINLIVITPIGITISIFGILLGFNLTRM